jgi:hypothetical protein
MFNTIFYKKKAMPLIIVFFLSFSFCGVFGKELECKDYGEIKLSQKEYDAVMEICDSEIEESSGKLKQIRGEAYGIKNKISQLDREIRISESYINKKIAAANRLKTNTKLTQEDIENLNVEQKKINDSLKLLIFQRNQIESNTVIEALLSKKTLSEFFDGVNTAAFLEKRISTQIKKRAKEISDLERLTSELEERELLERELAQDKRLETNRVKKNKQYRKELLDILKKEEGGIVLKIAGNEDAKRAILARQFAVASGEKVTFGEAYKIINAYKDRLKMDPAFVLAILFQESGWGGKIGGNIGQCTYNQKNSHGSKKSGLTVMKDSQKKAYLQIMSDLGLDANSQKISCPIPSDGSYGGAMGPAQFIPNTWVGTRKTAATIIGKGYEKMSPFDNRDSFVSSGVLLK